MRVREAGEVLAIDDAHLRTIVQTDSELSELFMRAYILRRAALMTAQSSDVILLGTRHSSGTLRLQQFLTRDSYPFVNLDIDSGASVREPARKTQPCLTADPPTRRDLGRSRVRSSVRSATHRVTD